MVFTKKMKMADVIHLNNLLLPVINRFNIKTGFGDDTVDEVCKKNKIQTDFFLAIINAFHDEDYFPGEQLRAFSIKNIIEYLSKTHQWYVDHKVPEIESLIDEYLQTAFDGQSNLHTLKTFFNDYKNELLTHIKNEEEVVYPFVIKLEEVRKTGELNDEFKESLDRYSIQVFASEHDNVDEKLFDLKNIIIKYLPEPKDVNLCNKVVSELFKLERDLKDHSRIEDKIMVPMAEEMEKEVREGIKKGMY